MFVVDTNVLVYAANARSELHAEARAMLEGWRRQATGWYLTWGICYEFLRVVTHPKVLRPAWSATEAMAFLSAVLASPALHLLTPSERHRSVLEEAVAAVPSVRGNLVHDLATAVLMREHGIRTVYTRDTDFHRFPFIEVVDPFRG